VRAILTKEIVCNNNLHVIDLHVEKFYGKDNPHCTVIMLADWLE